MSGRVEVRWPRPANEPERRAAVVARLAAGEVVADRRWRHAEAPELHFGVPQFAIPIVAGHVAEMLRLEGVGDDGVERVLAGEVPAEELRALYERALDWVIAQVETWSPLM